MQWWNSLSDWTGSAGGWRVVITTVVVPFVAIIVAGVIAALIGRGATKRVVALQERESKNAAVAGVISAARKAATWGTLGHDERSYADHLAEDADIRLRLLPVAGAPVAANWAQHEIADIKKNSATFSFQAEQSLAEFRDRMLEWQSRPSRARKLFRSDLERWKFETPDSDADLINRQQEWQANQVDASRKGAAPTAAAPAQSAPAASTPAPAAAPTTVAPVLPAVPTSSGSSSAPAAAVSPVADRPGTPALPRFGADADRDGDRDDRDSSDRSSNTSTTSSAQSSAQSEPPALQQPRPVTTPGSGIGSASASSSASSSASDEPESPGAPVPLTEPRVDATTGASATNTTSVPTRIADAPAEPADPNETAEAPYGAPVSASELRRRAEEDDE